MDFNQAEERFKHLKAKFEAGALSENEFKTQLEELMVQDEGGNWWMIGYETEQWYRYDGKAWVRSDPPDSKLQKPKITQPKVVTNLPEMKPEEQRNLWKFGKKESIQSAIGVVIFILLYYLFRGVYELRYLPLVVPLFFGLTFGPIVGAIVGAGSYIFNFPFLTGYPISEFFQYNFSSISLFLYMARGLIMGMAKVPIDKFRSRSGIFRAELFVIISLLTFSILSRNLSSLFQMDYLIEYLLPTMVINLVLIPISMVIYSLILTRIKSRKK